jgi:AMIN domain
MPRPFQFGVLLAALLLSGSISAQTPPKPAPRVQHVVVRGTGGAMEVEIQTSGAPVAPDTQAITGPDRIVVDFPGALPAAELQALKVNRGPLKSVRSGLFFSNPPITRIVLDLAQPQSYRISTTPNAVVVKLGPASAGEAAGVAETKTPTVPTRVTSATLTTSASPANSARLQNASLASKPAKVTRMVADRVSSASSNAISSAAVAPVSMPAPVSEAPQPPKSIVTVTFQNGLLTIHAEKATLAQVLFEVQRQTQADIAIPAGAENEGVAADLGPAPARDVLGSLLNGSPYNFIFVGNELSLERVILTRRDPSIF